MSLITTTPFLPDNQSYYEFYRAQTELNSYYIMACHVIPFVTLPIYAEAFYCVFHKCKQFSARYVTLLQFHMILHFIGEIHWTVLLLPVINLPGIGISADGFLSVLNISASWQTFAMCGILQVSCATLIHLLIYRLKFAIPPNSSNMRFVKFTADFLNVFFYVFVIFCTCAIGLLDEDQKVAKERMLEKYDVPPPNLWEPNFVTTDRENPYFKYYVYITCVEICFFIVNLVIIPTVSFYYLAQNRTEKSVKLAEAHKSTLQMLIFQLLIHCIFHLLPLLCFTYGVILRTKNLFFLTFGMLIWALHGAACTLALIVANKPFRLAMKSHLTYVFCCLFLKSKEESGSDQLARRRESTVIQKIDITN